MRCYLHDLRDQRLRDARQAKTARRVYQVHVDYARYYNWLIVARLRES